jgi:hypothetical protein
MTELIEKVKEAKKVLDDSQKDLLKWCRDTNTPLSERWPVWCRYVDKDEQGYIGCSNSELLSDLIDMWCDNRDFERHQDIDYDWLIEGLVDMWCHAKSQPKIKAILDKNKQYLRDKKIDAIVNDTDSSNTSKIVGAVPNPHDGKDEFENLLREEVMVANFGSCEFDW